MKILITGGSGYLGAHIRRYFGADDFSRRTGKDVMNPEHAAVVADYDAIVHLAASVDKSAGSDRRSFDVNVLGTMNLLERLRKGQAFLLMSTKEVYGRHADSRDSVSEECPLDHSWAGYEWSKFIAETCVEHYARRAGARAAVFRLSTAYAPLSLGNKGTFVNYFAAAIREGQKISLKSEGRQIRDFLHVDDLARAIERFLAGDLSYGLFNIGGGPQNSTTLFGLTEILGGLVGRAPNVELIDAPASGQTQYVTDNTKAARDLGWSPQISLEAGLQTIL